MAAKRKREDEEDGKLLGLLEAHHFGLIMLYQALQGIDLVASGLGNGPKEHDLAVESAVRGLLAVAVREAARLKDEMEDAPIALEVVLGWSERVAVTA